MSDVRARVRAYVERLAPGAPGVLDDAADLVATGAITSMQFLDLVMFIEDTFAVTVDPRDVFDRHFSSVDAIVAYVTARA